MNTENFIPFCDEKTVTGAEDLFLAPAAPFSLYIQRLIATILVSAAQSFDVQDTSGATKPMRVAVSPAVNVQFGINIREGIKLTTGEALRYVPSGAGLTVHFAFEGYIR